MPTLTFLRIVLVTVLISFMLSFSPECRPISVSRDMAKGPKLWYMCLLGLLLVHEGKGWCGQGLRCSGGV